MAVAVIILQPFFHHHHTKLFFINININLLTVYTKKHAAYNAILKNTRVNISAILNYFLLKGVNSMKTSGCALDMLSCIARKGLPFFFVLMIILLSACTGSDVSVKSQTGALSENEHSQSKNQLESGENNMPSTLSSISSASTATKSSVSAATKSSASRTISTVSSKTPSNNSEKGPSERPTANTIELMIDDYFPELPGYSTDYKITMVCDGKVRKAGEYTLTVLPGDLVVKGNIITATDQQKKTHTNFVVTATDKFTGKKAELTIKPKKWQVNFEDNFTGDRINTSIWSNFEYEYSNASVDKGVLTLLAERLMIGGKPKYTSSGIRTLSKYSLKCGCFMARMKSPDKGGCNSAFWLMPEGRYTRDAFFMDTEFPNVGCSEIDIVEYSAFYGNTFPITQHFWDSNGGQHRSRQYWGEIDEPIYNGFHDYACIWEPDGVYYYFDGKPVAANRYVNTHKNAVKAYIVLSTNSAKIHSGLEWLGPCTDDMFPFITQFDWVKTYY